VRNIDKRDLREYAEEGLTLRRIRRLVDCSDNTIRRYIKVYRPKKDDEKKEEISHGRGL